VSPADWAPLVVVFWTYVANLNLGNIKAKFLNIYWYQNNINFYNKKWTTLFEKWNKNKLFECVMKYYKKY
jgi:hypothetical protein